MSKYALQIFDIDGTLLDSMRLWENIAVDYIKRNATKPVPPDLGRNIDPMSLQDALEYLVKEFEIPGGIEALFTGIGELVEMHYQTDIPLFDDSIEILELAKAEGGHMVVFSNSPHKYIDNGIARLNLTGYFEHIFTTEDSVFQKNDPKSFQFVCEKMNCLPSDTLVHEDSDYARDAALKLGCHIKWYDRYRGEAFKDI